MISAYLHLGTLPILIIGAILAFRSWKSSHFGKDIIKEIIFLLVLLGVYHISLAMPILLGGGKAELAVGYIVGIIFLFSMLVPIIMIEAELLQISKVKRDFLVAAALLIAGVITVLNIMYPPLPEILDGFVFWNIYMPAAWLASISSFFILAAMSFIMLRGWPQHLTLKQKTKALFFTSGFALSAVSALVYFISSSISMTLLAFLTGYLGPILFVSSMLLKEGEKN